MQKGILSVNNPYYIKFTKVWQEVAQLFQQ